MIIIALYGEKKQKKKEKKRKKYGNLILLHSLPE